MSRHTGQTSSKLDTNSEDIHLAVLAQLNNCLMHEILPFKVTNYQNQDELNLLLNTAKQLIYHYFGVQQQLLLTLTDKASQVSRTGFQSYLIEIYGAQIRKCSILFYLPSSH